jgi:hypothetical protein
LAGSERLRLIPLVILGDDASRKFVHASLTGKWAIREVLMLVDTGAQKTVIDEVLAKELAVKYEQDVQLAGITSTVRTWMGRLPRLRLGTLILIHKTEPVVWEQGTSPFKVVGSAIFLGKGVPGGHRQSLFVLSYRSLYS